MSSNSQWPREIGLADILKAGSVIVTADTTEKLPRIEDVLNGRLTKFDESLNCPVQNRELDLPSLRLDTALASLYTVEQVQRHLRENEMATEKGEGARLDPPLIGSRDMQQLRTHIPIIFKWGAEELLKRVLPTLPNKKSPKLPPGAQIIDLTTAYEDYMALTSILTRLMKILFPEGVQGKVSQTFVSTTIITKNFTDFLRPCICIGWIPVEMRGDLPAVDELRTYTLRLLACCQPAQTITSIGHVLNVSSTLPSYVPRACSQLLCSQILRPYGVPGVFSALFGEDLNSIDAPLEKLERVSRVLNVVPAGVPREEYFANIIPVMIHLLAPVMQKVTPPAHKRASAFSLTRMLTTEHGTGRDIRHLIIGWSLHDPCHPKLKDGTQAPPPSETSPHTGAERKAHQVTKYRLKLGPIAALTTISTLLTNADPSPILISRLLSPLIPPLYSLLDFTRRTKTADPTWKEIAEGLLSTWARSVSRDDVVEGLWKVVQGEGGDWTVDDQGELQPAERDEQTTKITLTDLADLQEGNMKSGENPLGVRPDPSDFALFLKSINRIDVSEGVYTRVLDFQNVLLSQDDFDPLKKFLAIKLVFEIQHHLASSAPETSILRRPGAAHILQFVKHSLKPSDSEKSGAPTERLRSSLHFFNESSDQPPTEGDSDDEDLPGLEGVQFKDHLPMTAVNVLLALLEENPELSPRSEPILNEIYELLNPYTESDSDEIRPKAREARLVLTARIASAASVASVNTTKKRSEEITKGEDPQEKYQRALKLLQDPILPVRAHGLLLLRELVAPQKDTKRKRKVKKATGGEKSRPNPGSGPSISIVQGQNIDAPSVEPALIPAILNIFLESIQDDDSYIFLNAVQGLSAMVDGFGSNVLKGLVGLYTKGLGSSDSHTQKDLDVRVRIGEALGQVIRRCGSALGKYADLIIPPISNIVRTPLFPTTLRTSAVSLLAQCAETSVIAMVAYSSDVLSAMVDLIQSESVSATALAGRAAAVANAAKSSQGSQDANDNSSRSSSVQRSKATTTQRPKSRGGKKKKADLLAGDGKGSPDGEGRASGGKEGRAGADAEPDTMDARPTEANPKFPPLRRAALHFISLLVRSLISRIYDGGVDSIVLDIPGSVMKRGAMILNYVSAVDEDEVVRIMAREAIEHFDQLRSAMLGV